MTLRITGIGNPPPGTSPELAKWMTDVGETIRRMADAGASTEEVDAAVSNLLAAMRPVFVGPEVPRPPTREESEAGEDGVGVEYVFHASDTADEPMGAANRPDPSWNYDIPALRKGVARGTVTYYDGIPTNLDADNPYLHRWARPVPGTPEIGEDIGTVVWRYDGARRAVGEDGSPGPAAHINTVYVRSATEPAALSDGTDRVPTGTSDSPPAGTLPLWLNTGVYDPDDAKYRWNGWLPAGTPLDPPRVTASVTGDDVRAVVTDPSDATDVLGHAIRLQRMDGDGDWDDVTIRTHIGKTTSRGRGKTFANVAAGTYRAQAQVISLTRPESRWVSSASVTAVQATDNPPAKGTPPVLRFLSGKIRVTAEPADDRGSPLTNGTVSLFRNGTDTADRVAMDTTGPRQGWVWDFGPDETEKSRVVALTSGYYYAIVRWRNANGNGPVSEFSEALTIPGDGEDAVYFLQPVIEVTVRAEGGDDITDATGFDPNPASATLTLAEGSETKEVTVAGAVAGAGVAAALSGDDASEFEIVDI